MSWSFIVLAMVSGATAAAVGFGIGSAGPALLGLRAPLVVSSVAVLGGTLVGERILLGMTMERFRQVVSLAILLLGVMLLARAW